MDILSILLLCKPYAEIALFCLLLVNGSARGSIAAVSEIMQNGAKFTNEQALAQASALMGKYLPFIPDFVRRWIIQMVFDSMKKKVSEVKPV